MTKATINTTNPRDFAAGQRVEMHPATDLWMRGLRYGAVYKVTKTFVTVLFDRDGRTRSIRPEAIHAVIE